MQLPFNRIVKQCYFVNIFVPLERVKSRVDGKRENKFALTFS